MTYLSDGFHHRGNRCNKGGKHFFFFFLHDKDFSNVKKKMISFTLHLRYAAAAAAAWGWKYVNGSKKL